MASITFEGPDPTNLEQRASTVVNISDEAMLAVVQAFCELEGYNPEVHGDPGLFTIQKTVDFWTQKAEYNISTKAKQAAETSIQESLTALKASISVEAIES